MIKYIYNLIFNKKKTVTLSKRQKLEKEYLKAIRW